MWSKKPPFGKTTSSDDKKEVSNTEKQAGKTFGIFLPESWVNPVEKCKFLDYSERKVLARILVIL